MSNCNDDKNPLQHNGTSQAERLLPGLQADYVKVNEKEYADWIVFAAEFAAYLNYYDASNKAAGNWQVFFTNDISAILGTIAVQDIDGYRRQIKERFDFIKDDTNAANITAVKKKLHELFSVLLTMAKALDTYLNRLPENESESGNTIPLKNTLQNCIETKLAPALQRLIAYHKAATAQLLLAPGDFTGWKVLNTQVVAAETIINGSGLSKSWWRNGAASWNAYVTGIAADGSIFGNILWTEYRRINHAANHNLFASVFDLFTQNYAKIINEATSSLLKTLGNWNTHPAHYALFLAFLKLFRFAQADINTITQRHLDFYYKEVLQLLPKAAVPNKAHILIELAKMADDYALAQGTELKAGKDSAGKDVLYELDRETVFNKAKVALLKSVYKGDKNGKDNHPLAVSPSFTVLNEDRLFASPVINSDDGLGAKLTSASKEWHPYVNKKYEEAKLTDIVSPNAEIGFVMASHFLYLAEGQRKIIIRVATTAASALLLVDKKFDCYLTTEKEWFAVPLGNITPVAVGTMTNSLTCAEFIITLGGDVPAITDYNATVHGGTYNVKLPMVKMILKNFDFETYQYTALKDIKITMGEVKVEVGSMTTVSQTGLKQLFMAGDFGPLDVSKPFQPFGAQPKKDATFIIGSREIFTKLYAKIRLNIEWANLPADARDIANNTTYNYDPGATIKYTDSKPAPDYPTVKPQFLVNGVWKANNTNDSAIANVDIFNGVNAGVAVFTTGQEVNARSLIPYSETYNAYNAASSKGFMRLVLNGDFGHKKYITDLTTYLIEKSKSDSYVKSIGVKPVEPYTPTIQSLYISYVANTMENFEELSQDHFDNARTIKFFHVYPFGEAEQHKYISGEDVYLLPQFNHQEDATTVDHIGEFYVGVSDLQPQQVVNILFQVMEGTADPLMIKPPDHIHWSYLSANRWLPFNKNTVGDATRQLVQSGIVSFVIPADATTDNTLLPAGYIWLRAAVSQSAEAICKLISVDAQAALVTFAPNENADDFLEKALPASTIAKLKTPDASVKKVIQPYSSFGGRAKEQEDQFYVRVSERLRHKNRAITIWDYEHLVLENFPQIYKVKCLNHTKLVENPQTDEMEYNEVAPGYVTVITIPDLQNRNDTNPLKPYTNQNTLLEIESFLKTKISCHVNLGVRNPQFEEVRLQFDLKLLSGFDDFTFYKERLQQEITQFLTPWAFASQAAISFGGKIYKSVLIDFIEERPYVDFITNVKMFHRIDDTTPESGDLDEIVASTARSILVSALASKHVINEIITAELEEASACEGSSL
jgi:hypothetical protein